MTTQIRVNLSQALEGDDQENILLSQIDRITVHSIHDIGPMKYVEIEGHVRTPGRYLLHEDMRLSDLLFKVGGGFLILYWLKETYLERADLVRVAPDSITRTIEWFDLHKVLAGELEEDRLLRSDDLVRIYSIYTVRTREYARIIGEVKNPGKFEIEENTTSNDLIMRAGGFTPDAWPIAAEIYRVDPGATCEDNRITLISAPIYTTYAGRSQGVTLQNYGLVIVRRQPYWELQRNVTVTGIVAFPNIYSLEIPGERVDSITRRAGGLTLYANSNGARLLRRAEGASLVGVDLEHALKNPDSRDNLVMMPGDSLHVPEKINTIRISGEVGFPSSILHILGKSLKYYLDAAGGLTRSADRSRIQGVLANSVRWRPRFSILPDPPIGPGAEIVEPSKPDPEATTWKIIRDTTAILTRFSAVLLLL